MQTTLRRKMPLKDQLKKLRAAKDWTQQDLAMAAGIAMSAVTQMETGKIKNPRLNTLKALAGALGCSLDDLGKNDDPPPQPGVDEGTALPAPAKIEKFKAGMRGRKKGVK
jgi:transcriptional regulator with XRE-family HTH domain